MNLPNVDEAQNTIVENHDNTEIFLDKDNNLYKVKSSKVPTTDFQADIVDDSPEKVINESDLNATDVIQLLNTDGTIINIDKNALISNNNINNNNNNNSKNGNITQSNRKDEETVQISEFIERITAYKCKKCRYLSETLTDITKHINSKVCGGEVSI